MEKCKDTTLAVSYTHLDVYKRQRHDTVEYISPRALAEGAKTLCTAAAWVANEPELSFEREIPEDMKRELEKYFA